MGDARASLFGHEDVVEVDEEDYDEEEDDDNEVVIKRGTGFRWVTTVNYTSVAEARQYANAKKAHGLVSILIR